MLAHFGKTFLYDEKLFLLMRLFQNKNFDPRLPKKEEEEQQGEEKNNLYREKGEKQKDTKKQNLYHRLFLNRHKSSCLFRPSHW